MKKCLLINFWFLLSFVGCYLAYKGMIVKLWWTAGAAALGSLAMILQACRSGSEPYDAKFEVPPGCTYAIWKNNCDS
jgi:hypothetical protein